MRAKLLSAAPVLLSDVLPTFEHLGAKVSDEHPYEITPRGADPVWLYDFGLTASRASSSRRSPRRSRTPSSGSGAVSSRTTGSTDWSWPAGLSGREITIVRAIARYLRQAAIAFSDAYMERTLVGHPDVACLLVRLFGARFDPDERDPAARRRSPLELEATIDAVASLDEDRILRSFASVLRAMTRTNYYRRGEDGRPPATCPSSSIRRSWRCCRCRGPAA